MQDFSVAAQNKCTHFSMLFLRNSRLFADIAFLSEAMLIQVKCFCSQVQALTTRPTTTALLLKR